MRLRSAEELSPVYRPDTYPEAAMTDSSRAELETFDNPRPDRPYTIEFSCSEFTSLCPKTGQADFATIVVRYVPGPRCVELRSLPFALAGMAPNVRHAVVSDSAKSNLSL